MASGPSENWDEDFEFQKPAEPQHRTRTQSNRSKRNPQVDSRSPGKRASRTRSPRASTATEDWDNDEQESQSPRSKRRTHSPRASTATEDWDEDKCPQPTLLAAWAEPGPSTPTRRVSNEENWDDDFEDNNANSPGRTKAAVSTAWDSPRHPLETRKSPSQRSRKANTTPKRSFSESSDSDAEFGFGKADAEDRTVTARSRRAAKHSSPPPPVPALPASFLGPGLFGMDDSSPAPFPRSPTASVFSVPNRDSNVYNAYTYGSSSHLALRPTHSNASSALSHLPPSPPIHRERRRLRKKSRARGDVFELGSVNEPPSASAEEEISAEEATDAPSSPPAVSELPPSSPPGSALLLRIGSVKKWGVRKKRASTAPNELGKRNVSGSSATTSSSRMDSDDLNLTPRPASSMSTTSTTSPPPSTKTGGSSNNWFFRGSGGAGSPSPGTGKMELKHQGSLKRLKQLDAQDSPTKYLMKRRSFAFSRGSEDTPPMEPLQTTPRRPTSMQVPITAKQPIVVAASLGRAAAARIGSASVDDLPRGGLRRATDSVEDIGRARGNTITQRDQGSRSFMGSVRKLSLVGGGKHKRGKSAAIPTQATPRPNAPPTPALEYQYHAVPPLLPPIALQPPSPPRKKREKEEEQVSTSATLESLRLPTDTHSRKSSASSIQSPISPHSASLGRSTAVAVAGGVPRRNSLGDLQHGGSLGRVREGSAVVDHHDTTLEEKKSYASPFGDLKIPARISQAQTGLKRDLGMVKEFAANIEQLKALQTTYSELVAEVSSVIERHEPVATNTERPVSPNVFKTPRRNRSNTNPVPGGKQSLPSAQAQQAYKQLVTAFYSINSKYRISWECAELLIELGGGTPEPPTATTSVSAPVTLGSQSVIIPIPAPDGRKSRERAITLAGDEKPSATFTSSSVPSPAVSPPKDANVAWRASTGRHDLSSRQLMLLREMLTNGSSDDGGTGRRTPIHEESGSPGRYGSGTVRSDWGTTVNRDWRWGDAMGSTVTLQSDESAHGQGNTTTTNKKKRRSSKMGMSGLRDLLRSIKRGVTEGVGAPPLPTTRAHMSTVSLSTDSSHDGHGNGRQSSARRRIKPTHSESLRSPTAPFADSSLNQPHKSSPRRPSLASIFRLGQKGKTTSSSASSSVAAMATPVDEPSSARKSGHGSSTDDADFDEDWDRMDSNSDLDAAGRAAGIGPDGTATVRGIRGRSPYLQGYDATQRPITPKRNPSGSRSSLWGGDGSSPQMRSARLSNVEESDGGGGGAKSRSRVSLTNSSPKASSSRKLSLTRKGSKKGKKNLPQHGGGSMRSAPPQSHIVKTQHNFADPKLAMTPENIKPLLENAREVHARLNDCIEELRVLLAVRM